MENIELKKYHGMVPLNEMAYTISGYRKEVSSISKNIVLNYCLVIYAGLDPQYEKLRNHWKVELRTAMVDLATDKLSRNNTSQNRKKYIMEHWTAKEYNDQKITEIRISPKFESEKIDTESQKFKKCVSIFIEHFDEIIDLLASGDPNKIKEHVKNI